MIDSVYKIGKNYHPWTSLEECKYAVKLVKPFINDKKVLPMILRKLMNLMKKMMQIKAKNHVLVENKIDKKLLCFSLMTIRIIKIKFILLKLGRFFFIYKNF